MVGIACPTVLLPNTHLPLVIFRVWYERARRESSKGRQTIREPHGGSPPPRTPLRRVHGAGSAPSCGGGAGAGDAATSARGRPPGNPGGSTAPEPAGSHPTGRSGRGRSWRGGGGRGRGHRGLGGATVDGAPGVARWGPDGTEANAARSDVTARVRAPRAGPALTGTMDDAGRRMPWPRDGAAPGRHPHGRPFGKPWPHAFASGPPPTRPRPAARSTAGCRRHPPWRGRPLRVHDGTTETPRPGHLTPRLRSTGGTHPNDPTPTKQGETP